MGAAATMVFHSSVVKSALLATGMPPVSKSKLLCR
jgi:hypothetical protein